MRSWTRIAACAALTVLAAGCSTQPGPPSPQSPTTPSPTSSPTGVVLTGTGVGGQPFGAPRSQVEPVLRQALGEPTKVSDGTGCPMDPAWTTTMQWQGLAVSFEADTAKRTDRTALTTWQVRPADGVPAAVSLGDGLPTTPTFAQLTAQYPSSEVTQQLGWYLLEVPGGVTYLGPDRTKPDTIQGGPIKWCE